MNPLLAEARQLFHQNLISEKVLTIAFNGIPSNADKSSCLSINIAKGIAKLLNANFDNNKLNGQTLGSRFELICRQFLLQTFPKLQNLRPGKWHIEKLGNRNISTISSFSQYEHLEYLNHLKKNDARLAASIGNDYMVAPDIVVYREPESDHTINNELSIVDNTVCTQTDIRQQNNRYPILHASVSAKWTMRSDRAQNSRTEALGLIRNRKGRLPHIVVVTGEPMPSRLASLALGTGDIDCVYHFALYELVETVKRISAEDSVELLDILIKGKRLKDISDLPLDLTV